MGSTRRSGEVAFKDVLYLNEAEAEVPPLSCKSPVDAMYLAPRKHDFELEADFHEGPAYHLGSRNWSIITYIVES